MRRSQEDRGFNELMDLGNQALLNDDSFNKASEYFQQAAAMRPGSAKAHGLVALTQAMIAEDGGQQAGAAVQMADRAARAALAIDSKEPNARLALLALQRSTLDVATNEDRLRAILDSAPDEYTGDDQLVGPAAVGGTEPRGICLDRAGEHPSNRLPRASNSRKPSCCGSSDEMPKRTGSSTGQCNIGRNIKSCGLPASLSMHTQAALAPRWRCSRTRTRDQFIRPRPFRCGASRWPRWTSARRPASQRPAARTSKRQDKIPDCQIRLFWCCQRLARSTRHSTLPTSCCSSAVRWNLARKPPLGSRSRALAGGSRRGCSRPRSRRCGRIRASMHIVRRYRAYRILAQARDQAGLSVGIG